MPVLGQGTWRMAEDPARRASEIEALRLGLDLGLTLIDTAEMYGQGATEELVAEAIAGRRDEVFLVSKVWPSNASRRGTIEACERSLRRLQTDRLDLYLLHWPGEHELGGTIEAFLELVETGKISHWGVSNFGRRELADVVSRPGGDDVHVDQMPYSASRRGIEAELLPWCRDRGIVVMAYSPLDQGRLLRHPAVTTIAERHGVSPATVGTAWVLLQDGVNVIPKAGTPEHVRATRAAVDFVFEQLDLELLDEAFLA
ncbi:MAG: aldo/keto reductase [Gaiellaceae bacterium]